MNGEVRQNSVTSDMIFSVEEMVSYASKFMILLPGDVIATGTPSGVAALQSGDRLELRSPALGAFCVDVEEDTT